jgi:hypothetical protein
MYARGALDSEHAAGGKEGMPAVQGIGCPKRKKPATPLVDAVNPAARLRDVSTAPGYDV